MARLDDLPEEVVRMICLSLHQDLLPDDLAHFSGFSEEGNMARKALRQLCMVSSRYRRISQPVLWRSCGEKVTDSKMPALLLRSVLEYPHLAAHMERLDLFGTIRNAWLEPPDDTEAIEAAIRGFDVDFADDWINRLNEDPDEYGGGLVEAFGALFLALLPKLKAFTLCWPHDSSLILSNLAGSRDKFPGCKLITELVIRHGDQEGGFAFGREGIALLTLPTLRYVNMGMILEDVVYDRLEPRSLGITSLQYQDAGVGAQSFRSLLKACKFIHTLKFEGADPIVMQDALDLTPLTPRSVVEELCASHHKSSLKTLTLDFRGFFQYWDEDTAAVYGIDGSVAVSNSLSQLDALEELTIDHESLTADAGLIRPAPIAVKDVLVTNLPASIKTLTIRWASSVFHPAVEKLADEVALEKGKRKFPHLESLSIMIDNDLSGYRLKHESVAKRFEDTGIAYNVLDEEY